MLRFILDPYLMMMRGKQGRTKYYFWVFGMILPCIEPRSPGSLVHPLICHLSLNQNVAFLITSTYSGIPAIFKIIFTIIIRNVVGVWNNGDCIPLQRSKSHQRSGVVYDTKLRLMAPLQFWRSDQCEILFSAITPRSTLTWRSSYCKGLKHGT